MLEDLAYGPQGMWGDDPKMAAEFFSERADQSEVKALIVSQYFDIWAKVIAPNTMLSDGKLAYIDLFAGPGRYEDGSASTPLMVLGKAIANPKVAAALVSIFNDMDENHTKTLRKEIEALPGRTSLKYDPQIYEGQVDRSISDYFEKTKLVPTFSFIDPFGYKGLSWSLIRSVIKDWGSDCVFFFNYSRINAGINNPSVNAHMEALFGKENLEHLRASLNASQINREGVIMEHLKAAMIEAGAKYVQMFRFRNENNKRTTHHLVFVTKHSLGYELMKEVMSPHSSHFDQGVPSYEYAPSIAGLRKLFENAQDKLEDRLVKEFAGQTLTMVALYHRDNLGRPYIKKNYKDALAKLRAAGRINTDRVPKEGTFADGIVVTFPTKPIGRE
jgi:three-Cys-motif partner protein